jgi:hypothetical protein
MYMTESLSENYVKNIKNISLDNIRQTSPHQKIQLKYLAIIGV